MFQILPPTQVEHGGENFSELEVGSLTPEVEDKKEVNFGSRKTGNKRGQKNTV